jgi:hypothetical protein
MPAWLRSLIDGLACIASFGANCGERRAPKLWAMSDTEQVAYLRRYLTPADLDTITSDWRLVGDASVTTARDTSYRGVAFRETIDPV